MSPVILSEDALLALIDRAFPREHRNLALGRGDDCAECFCPERIAVSTDLFLEDVHFRRRYFLPEEIGSKALAVNLSDLAAAGAVPLGFSVGLMCPVPFPTDLAKGIITGLAAMAARHDVPLTGGDISRADKLGFCITVWGAPVPGRNFLRRGPVAVGDALFLIGHPGLARAGLTVLEEAGRDALSSYPAACTAQLSPGPLLAEGQFLAGMPARSGCRLMDLSDGLARDLPRLLGRGGAELTLPEDALHPELLALCRLLREDPVAFAFAGGEEYGLLGACSEPDFAALVDSCSSSLPLRRIGTVTTGTTGGITLNGARIAATGFDHFTMAGGV